MIVSTEHRGKGDTFLHMDRKMSETSEHTAGVQAATLCLHLRKRRSGHEIIGEPIKGENSQSCQVLF